MPQAWDHFAPVSIGQRDALIGPVGRVKFGGCESARVAQFSPLDGKKAKGSCVYRSGRGTSGACRISQISRMQLKVDEGIQKAGQAADKEVGGRGKGLIDDGAAEAEKAIGGQPAPDSQ